MKRYVVAATVLLLWTSPLLSQPTRPPELEERLKKIEDKIDKISTEIEKLRRDMISLRSPVLISRKIQSCFTYEDGTLDYEARIKKAHDCATDICKSLRVFTNGGAVDWNITSTRREDWPDRTEAQREKLRNINVGDIVCN